MRNFIAAAAAAAAVTAGVVGVPSGAQAAAVPSCKGVLLAVSHNQQQGATGHGNVVLRFRNVSRHTCSLRGYPGVDALGPHGAVLAHAQRTLRGFTGGTSAVRTIVLRSWQVASADLEWMNFGPNGTSCRFSHSIAVTPANTFRTVHFPLSVSACDLQIHPTVKGPTGNGA